MDENAFTPAKSSLDARLAAAPYLALAVLTIGVLLFLAGANAVGVAPSRWEHPHAADAEYTRKHDAAVQAFLDQRYSAAYGRFAALADEGHAASALVALAMVSQGSSMFGSDWSATPAQLHRWSAMAVEEVRDRGVRITDHDRGE